MFIYYYHDSFIYDQVAETEKLKPLELDLKRLEDLSQDIVLEFADMKKQSDIMRNTNGKLLMSIIYKFLK